MYEINPVTSANIIGFNNYNFNRKEILNNKTGVKCTDCINCKEMICSKTRKRVLSINDANRCSNYSKLSFSSFLKK